MHFSLKWAFCLLGVGVVLQATGVAGAYKSTRITEKVLDWQPQLLTSTPMIDPPTRVAGQFKLNRTHDAHMFYFFFQSRSTSPETDPVVLWMTGGPGCSSELAIFYENGPYTLNKNMTLTETKYGWDAYHNMIFVDQPINTGFSYSNDPRDRVSDEHLVGEDMLDFLWEFYKVHPELADNEFFVTGESYAGHYVPAVASAVYRARELGHGPRINLKGLAIGNGLTVPGTQFPAYGDFAYDNKLIDDYLHNSIKWWSPYCSWAASVCDAYDWRFVCVIALEFCQATIFERILAANPGINVYDITKKCEGSLCYDFTDMDKFLNLPDVRKALGVGTRPWQACSPLVYSDFMGDWLKSYDKLLPIMMEDDVRVMIYAGDLDLICNWLGNERWVDALEWEGQEEFKQANPLEWTVGGQVAGSVREAGPLSFVKVYKAGHMVPMDQPQSALDMITRFTRGKSLITRAKDTAEVAQMASTKLAKGDDTQDVTRGSRLRSAADQFLQLALGRKAVRTNAAER